MCLLKNTSVIKAFILMCFVVTSSIMTDAKKFNSPDEISIGATYATRGWEKFNVIYLNESPFFAKIDSIIEMCKKKYPKYNWKERVYFDIGIHYTDNYHDIDRIDFKKVNNLDSVSRPISILILASAEIHWDAIVYKGKTYPIGWHKHWKYYTEKQKPSRKSFRDKRIPLYFNYPMIVINYDIDGTMEFNYFKYGRDE